MNNNIEESLNLIEEGNDYLSNEIKQVDKEIRIQKELNKKIDQEIEEYEKQIAEDIKKIREMRQQKDELVIQANTLEATIKCMKNVDIDKMIQNEKEALQAEIDYEEQREAEFKKIIAGFDEKLKKKRLALGYNEDGTKKDETQDGQKADCQAGGDHEAQMTVDQMDEVEKDQVEKDQVQMEEVQTTEQEEEVQMNDQKENVEMTIDQDEVEMNYQNADQIPAKIQEDKEEEVEVIKFVNRKNPFLMDYEESNSQFTKLQKLL